jgi:hypothetical protein
MSCAKILSLFECIPERRKRNDYICYHYQQNTSVPAMISYWREKSKEKTNCQIDNAHVYPVHRVEA